MTFVRVPSRLLQATRRAAGWTLAAALLASTVHAATRDAEPRWDQLTPAERQVLQPLQHEWPLIDTARKQKWRELAAQFPSLTPERQALLRSRMNAWARMTPAERAEARLRYQEAKRVPEAERAERWQRYQSLPEDQRQALVNKAQRRAVPAAPAAAKPTPSPTLADVQPKSNIVPSRVESSPAPSASRAIAPGTVRATVGASTRPIDQRPPPPPHQQPGLPKIVASPEFVDRTTLLPRRGPQGAATVHTDLERDEP